jgi:hypothetical protein
VCLLIKRTPPAGPVSHFAPEHRATCKRRCWLQAGKRLFGVRVRRARCKRALEAPRLTALVCEQVLLSRFERADGAHVAAFQRGGSETHNAAAAERRQLHALALDITPRLEDEQRAVHRQRRNKAGRCLPPRFPAPFAAIHRVLLQISASRDHLATRPRN